MLYIWGVQLLGKWSKISLSAWFFLLVAISLFHPISSHLFQYQLTIQQILTEQTNKNWDSSIEQEVWNAESKRLKLRFFELPLLGLTKTFALSISQDLVKQWMHSLKIVKYV